MSIIPCSGDCLHQTEGYCTLESVSAVTNSAGGCPYFQKIKPAAKKSAGISREINSNRFF